MEHKPESTSSTISENGHCKYCEEPIIEDGDLNNSYHLSCHYDYVQRQSKINFIGYFFDDIDKFTEFTMFPNGRLMYHAAKFQASANFDHFAMFTLNLKKITSFGDLIPHLTWFGKDTGVIPEEILHPELKQYVDSHNVKDLSDPSIEQYIQEQVKPYFSYRQQKYYHNALEDLMKVLYTDFKAYNKLVQAKEYQQALTLYPMRRESRHEVEEVIKSMSRLGTEMRAFNSYFKEDQKS